MKKKKKSCVVEHVWRWVPTKIIPLDNRGRGLEVNHSSCYRGKREKRSKQVPHENRGGGGETCPTLGTKKRCAKGDVFAGRENQVKHLSGWSNNLYTLWGNRKKRRKKKVKERKWTIELFRREKRTGPV